MMSEQMEEEVIDILKDELRKVMFRYVKKGLSDAGLVEAHHAFCSTGAAILMEGLGLDMGTEGYVRARDRAAQMYAAAAGAQLREAGYDVQPYYQ